MLIEIAKTVENDEDSELIKGNYNHDLQQFICEGGYPSHLENDPEKGLMFTMSTNPLAKDIGR